MNRRISGALIGVILGALVLGGCTSSLLWALVGALIGGIAVLAFVVARQQMAKDRETGLNG